MVQPRKQTVSHWRTKLVVLVLVAALGAGLFACCHFATRRLHRVENFMKIGIGMTRADIEELLIGLHVRQGWWYSGSTSCEVWLDAFGDSTWTISLDSDSRVTGIRFWSVAIHGYSVSWCKTDLLEAMFGIPSFADRQFLSVYFVFPDGSVRSIEYSIGRPECFEVLAQ
jgi:hypothetical protein